MSRAATIPARQPSPLPRYTSEPLHEAATHRTFNRSSTDRFWASTLIDVTLLCHFPREFTERSRLQRGNQNSRLKVKEN